MHIGFSVAVFPTSWGLSATRIRGKSMLAIGPFRFCLHRVQGSLTDYRKD